MPPRRPSLRFIIGSVGILVATFAVYAVALQNDFVEWDDGYLIYDNPAIRTISLSSLHRIFTTFDPELYIPLTFLSYQVDHAIAGLHPAMFHLTNLLIHAGNALLIAAICYRLGRNVGIGIACGFLFAVHPLNTETVVWASARKDLLSGFFFLLSMCCYLRSTAAEVQGSLLRRSWYFWSLLSFFLGLLSKVSIATLPLVLLLIDWWQRQRIERHVLLEKIPFFLLSIVFGVIAILGKTRNVASTSLIESLLLGTKSTMFYLQKLFVPLHLSVLYPYTREISFGNIDLLIPLLLTTALLALAWVARRRLRILTFGIAWYFVTLLPSFTTFRKGDDIELDLYFASDRYAYLPHIGVLFLITSLGANLCAYARTHREEMQRQKTAIGLVGAGVVALGFLSFHQSQTWRTTETLFQNVIRSYPNAHIAQNNLGLFEQGRGHYTAAIDHYQKALAIRPTGRTYYNLGLTYIAQGERAKALEANRMALQINPHHARAHLNLGGLLLENGKTMEAIQQLNTAISIDPALALAHFDLGLAYERLGKLPMAEEAYTRALEKDPNDIETLVSLASLLVRKRQVDDALLLLKHAIALQPHHPRYESLLLKIAQLQGKKL